MGVDSAVNQQALILRSNSKLMLLLIDQITDGRPFDLLTRDLNTDNIVHRYHTLLPLSPLSQSADSALYTMSTGLIYLTQRNHLHSLRSIRPSFLLRIK